MRMKFERTAEGEIIPPADWNTVTMDTSGVENDGHLFEVIASIHDAGLVTEIRGDLLTATRRETARDCADELAVKFFNTGIAPSLEHEGFKNIRFS